jgi:hypothetical protein
MLPLCTEGLVHARMAERLAEIDLASAPVRMPTARGRRRSARRKGRQRTGSIT